MPQKSKEVLLLFTKNSNADTQGNLMKINVLNTALISRKQQCKQIYGEEATDS